MSVKVEMKPISVIKARLGLQHKGPAHKFFTHTCAIHMDKYVPYREGTLATTVVEGGNVTSNVTEDTITYAQKYAHYMYEGKLYIDPETGSSWTKKGSTKIPTETDLNYSTSMHANAGPYWDKRMWSAEKDEIIKEVQDYVRTHGGK